MGGHPGAGLCNGPVVSDGCMFGASEARWEGRGWVRENTAVGEPRLTGVRLTAPPQAQSRALDFKRPH